MTETIDINLAVEDVLSEETLRKLLAVSGRHFTILQCYRRGGYGYLKTQVAGFNQASRITPFLLLTDLDTEDCAPSLIADWLPSTRHSNFLFRVAVREVESWLLADQKGLAGFLSVSQAVMPRDPETLADPKRELVSLAKRSRRREIREAIVPRPKTTAKQGPDYNGCLSRFVSEHWNPHVAKTSSDSLRRILKRLNEFKPI